MASSALKILREVNNFTQEFIAEDVLGISQATYARIEQNPGRITGEQAQKLADIYHVSIANLLSEATPVVTFHAKAVSENNNGVAGYIQTQNVESKPSDSLELLQSLQKQNELLAKQNATLTELVRVLSTNR